MLAPDEFIIAGTGVIDTYESVRNEGTIAGIVNLDAGSVINVEWVPPQHMNGDQSHQGKHICLIGREFSMQKVKRHSYK